MVQKSESELVTGAGTGVTELDSGSGVAAYVYYMRPPESEVRQHLIGGDGGGSGGVGGGSGQCSSSDTLDSGTCSDIEVTPPPPLPKKMSQLLKSSATATALALATINSQQHTDSRHETAAAAAAVVTGAQSGIPDDSQPAAAAIDKDGSGADTGPGSVSITCRAFSRDQEGACQDWSGLLVSQLAAGVHCSHVDDDDDDDRITNDNDIDNENGDGEQEQQLHHQSLHTRNGHHGTVTDSDGSESCLSCDSLNLDKLGVIVQSAEGNSSNNGDGGSAGAVIHAINIQHTAFNASIPPVPDGSDAQDLKPGSPGTPSRKYPASHLSVVRSSCSSGLLPDSLLAAIRGNRPRVYDEAKLAQLTAPAGHYDKDGELINTTRSILMDKINSLHAATNNHGEQQHQHQQQQQQQRSDQLLPNNPSSSSTSSSSSSSTHQHTTTGTGNNQMRGSFFESDRYYKFHIHERSTPPDATANGIDSAAADQAAASSLDTTGPSVIDDDESFAGLKDLTSGTSTIRSNKGTVRGVKNRVRNGIATFLQMQQTTGMKNYKDKESGKVVIYSTSMGIVRETYTKCMSVKQILRTLLVKFEEKDIFMSNEYQQEIRERMQTDCVTVPQVFVDGQHFGDAECIERLNETGELRKMLKPYKCLESPYTCKVCGGYRLLPCPSCGGSKKSIHRNHFTAEFVALKCMNCDEVGLVKCHNC